MARSSRRPWRLAAGGSSPALGPLAAGLVLAGALLAGCYQPSLRDCTVSCHAAGDCASGQICGSDGWCAAPDVAGTCGLIADGATVDGSVVDGSVVDGPEHDGPVADASNIDASRPDARPDASPPDAAGAVLHVLVSGHGKVLIDPLGVECTSPPGDCSYGANPGDTVSFTAKTTDGSHKFLGWTTSNCMGQGVQCVTTIIAPATTVGAQFE